MKYEVCISWKRDEIDTIVETVSDAHAILVAESLATRAAQDHNCDVRYMVAEASRYVYSGRARIQD